MDELDADDNKRVQLLKELQELISDGPNGDFLKNLINKKTKQYNVNVTL